jgi:hypothetical protein
MKKTQRSKTSKSAQGEMRPEYNFDYRKALPNRFAGRVDEDRVIVVLDPDVSEVFSTQQAVNTALQALMTALQMPSKPKPARH